MKSCDTHLVVEPSCVSMAKRLCEDHDAGKHQRNISHFYVICSRTLLPWTIFQEQDGRTTVKELYDRVTTASEQTLVREHIFRHHVQEVRIGHSTKSLDILGNTGMYLSFKNVACS